jgi:hypothetical protein
MLNGRRYLAADLGLGRPGMTGTGAPGLLNPTSSAPESTPVGVSALSGCSGIGTAARNTGG